MYIQDTTWRVTEKLPHGEHGRAAYLESVQAASEAGAPTAAEDGKQGRSNANFEFGLGGDHCRAVVALHLLWAVQNDLQQNIALIMNLSTVASCTRVYLRNFSLVKMWLPTRGGVPQDPLRCSAATRPISDLRKQRASDWRQIWVLKEPDCALTAEFVTGTRCRLGPTSAELGSDIERR
jgi:hypothetical protein